ncbi:MAG: hypothetical protein Q9178_002703 [Gyalolechia marmorata]
MATNTVSRRSLQGFILLLVSALLLLISAYHGAFEFKHGFPKASLTKRQLDLETVPAVPVSTTLLKTIGLPFGRQHHTVNFTTKSEDHPKRHTKQHLKHLTQRHVKRGSKEDFDYHKGQGDIAYDQMVAACESSAQDFEPSALGNGWTRQKDIKYPPEKVWVDAVKQLAGEAKVPTAETSFYVDLHHDKDFINNQGQPVKLVPNKAHYAQWFIPASSAIIVAATRSPYFEVKRRFEFDGKPVPSSREINDQYVPPLHRWSDVTWALWKEKGGGNDLRYIGRDFIANPRTESVMQYIFSQAGKGDEPPFPGLEFGMDSDEGRALLGTPNGIGTARLLIDRASELGRRDIRFHIFYSEPDSPCMMIDMRPTQAQSRALARRRIEPPKTPSEETTLEKLYRVPRELRHPASVKHRDELLKSYREIDSDTLVKRDAASDYDKALCTGRAMWDKITAAFDGQGDTAQIFPISALRNGWSKKDEPQTLDPEWRQYFDTKLGPDKVPSRDDVRYVTLVQDEAFYNSEGEDVADISGTEEAGTALYYAYYIPGISSVIIKNMVSPANVVKALFTAMGQAVPSNAEIAANYVPPLDRWSDVTWTLYADIAAQKSSDPNALRYIAHSSIINRATQVVMAYIFQRQSGGVNVPYPGLEFGMDSEEGLALLGTPNGMGTGWLMQDRAEKLGRRNPKVTIWTEGAKAMMVWDLAPA